MSSVYMLTFHNGNAYIGKTKHTITRRVRAHCSEARRGKSQCLIHKAIRKYRAKQMTVRALRWKTYYEKKEAENVQTGK